MLDLGPAPRTRRPSLTPLIDVVFLLLVFFMLAARFAADRSVPLTPPGDSDGVYAGAPRIITVAKAGLALNGAPITLDNLAAALTPLMPTADALIVLQSGPDATLQDLVVVIDHLAEEDLGTVVIAE
ncbi:MAG: ExbD/TolR family protein [Pikeienuella sp.]